MDLGSAAITAGGSLLEGLFGSAAKKKAQEREQAALALQASNRAQGEAAESLSKGQSAAMGSLMDAWHKALLR